MATTLTKNDQGALTKEAPRRATYLTPPANILETKEGYVLLAEMPGVGKEGLEVTVENNELVILGHRSDPLTPESASYRESRRLDYRRVFDLDPSIDATRISARMDQGILTLTLPKSEALKPRKITVS